LKGTVPGERF
ncbi:hypothetical protein CP10743SC13_1974B, partial [Chlamydia psittaci 10_743_SC13]